MFGRQFEVPSLTIQGMIVNNYILMHIGSGYCV